MKICLIYADNDMSSGTEHLGIAYITAYLKEHGYVVDLYDCTAMQMDLNNLLAILKRKLYDIVGFSCYQDNYLYTLRTILYLRSIKLDTFIFIGGYLPTLSIEKLKPHMNIIDCAVMGEGEEITLQLIRNIKTGNWKETKGIAYIAADRLVFTEKGSRVEHLDRLPFPVRLGNNRNTFNIIASRGCTGNCSFCSIRSFSKHNDCQRIRRRSPQNIVSEIESCMRMTDLDADTPIIFFYDEQFFNR